MKQLKVTLSDGNVAYHIINDIGMTEVVLENGDELNDWQWLDYVKITTPKPNKKLTWAEIKAKGM